MGSINWKDIFPNKKTVIIFILYVTLFINQGILVKWSQHDGEYHYNTVIVVLMTEVFKLFSCLILYFRENSTAQLFHDIKKYRRVLLLYMVPSFLYCLYNNLAFVNLAAFDPTTYFLLLQLRVVVTGVIFQVIFNKQLSCKQWLSLLLLTFGCMMKHINLNFENEVTVTSHINFNLILILIQTICSCLAGVYNEYLLKGEGAEINIFVQNVFMYTDSIVCNLAVLTVQGELISAFKNTEASIFMNIKVLMIIFNNAAVGIITSFFLKNLNSIVKTFASALELVFTAIFCWILFSIPIHLNTAIAIIIVIYAVILYSQNPVQNVVQKLNENDFEKKIENL